MKVYHLEKKENKPNVEVVCYDVRELWKSMSFYEFIDFLCSYTYLNKRYAKYIASIFNG